MWRFELLMELEKTKHVDAFEAHGGYFNPELHNILLHFLLQSDRVSPQTRKFDFQICSNFCAVGGLRGKLRNKNKCADEVNGLTPTNVRGKMCYWSILVNYFQKGTHKICILEMFDTSIFRFSPFLFHF